MEIKLKNEFLKPPSITLFLLNFVSKGDEISTSDTLKLSARKKLVEKIIINRTYEIKNIYTFDNVANLFKICIIYINEKTKFNI
tara:strand:+ start:1401 stop:1652 length:252 start_codon:yes stop_codon:yes gene_type:complete